jgi:hypothetical protein
MYLMKEIHEINVKWFVAEVFANHLENPALQDERVVYGLKSNSLCAVPAGPPSSGGARILDVVRNVEMGLELEWAIILGSAVW